jgi:hypothetical protein
MLIIHMLQPLFIHIAKTLMLLVVILGALEEKMRGARSTQASTLHRRRSKFVLQIGTCCDKLGPLAQIYRVSTAFRRIVGIDYLAARAH